MKVLHLIGGGDIGGAKSHVLSLVKELNKHIDVKIVSFRPGVFSEDARSMGIDIKIVKSYNIFNDIRTVLKIIKEDKIELLHSHGAKANMIAMIVRLITRIPTATTIHSDYRLDYLHSIYKRYSIWHNKHAFSSFY